jgi:hypothetical protein
MPINNVQAVKFANEKIRVAADKLAATYYFAKSVCNEWYARNMGATIPVSSDEIIDGSAVDGRPVITANDINVLMQSIESYVNKFEANNNAELNAILKIAPNPIG